MTDSKQKFTLHEISIYLKNHKNWPLEKQVIQDAEKEIKQYTASEQLEWFAHHPPLSAAGKIAHVKALIKHKSEHVKSTAQRYWSNTNFTPQERTAFLTACGNYLSEQDHMQRINYLFFTNQQDEIQHILPLVKSNRFRKEIQLRFCIYKGKITHLQKTQQNLSDGLRYQWIRFCRINRKDEEAYLWLIQSIKDNPEYAEQWWIERNWMARRFIEYAFLEPKKKTLYLKKALDVIAHHNLKSGEKYADACFLQGFLQYKMHSFSAAFKTFSALYDNVKTPMSKSRAAYWAGISAVKANNDHAKSWFEKAAHHPMTFYGQVATLRLKRNLHVSKPGKGHWPTHNNLAETLKQFRPEISSDLIQPFCNATIESSHSFEEAEAFCNFVKKNFNTTCYIRTCKKAAMKFGKNPMGHDMLPLVKIPKKLTTTPLDRATIQAIIYRESECDRFARSEKGALGFMQLIPKTAKAMARKLGIRIKNENDILNADNNIKLGFHNIKHVLDANKGSYVIGLCCYNTDPCNVRTWLKDYGDPRNKNMNVIEWIECIPFYETRSYVIRVLENIVNYLVATGYTDIAKQLYKKERIYGD